MPLGGGAPAALRHCRGRIRPLVDPAPLRDVWARLEEAVQAQPRTGPAGPPAGGRRPRRAPAVGRARSARVLVHALALAFAAFQRGGGGPAAGCSWSSPHSSR